MKYRFFLIILSIIFFSCKSKTDKAVSHLDTWFNGFDSVHEIDSHTKKYFKSTDFTIKEVAVESVIDKEIGSDPNDKKIEYKDSLNNTQSYYKWDFDKSKVLLKVFYTDPNKTPGMRYEITVTK